MAREIIENRGYAVKEELEQKLLEKYPQIFPEGFGIGCGDGWYTIIDRLCANIQNYIDDSVQRRAWYLKNKPTEVPPEVVPQVVAEQVKEKFSTLRFYYSGGDGVTTGMIWMAESLSGVTCEVCGNPGERRTGGWLKTLCDIHHLERKYDQDR